MDKIDLLGAQQGRISLFERPAAQLAKDREQATDKVQQAVAHENERAAKDIVEISAEALELLRQSSSD